MSHVVSVIIPTHKRPHFLARAVDSVLAQSYAQTQVVVVDDNEPGSPERSETQAVMHKYADDPRVLYILNAHSLGGGPARNEGIKACNGEFVTFLDDDDIFLPDKISRQLAFMIENKLEMSFTDVYIHNDADKLVEFRCHDYVTDCSNDALLRCHILHSLGPTSTFMISADILRQGAFRDVPMGQDFMLMWDMIERKVKIGYLPGSDIVQYLHSGERISVGKNKVNGENRLYKLKKTHFDMLTPGERRYVRFRHNAVLSVSLLRSKKFPSSIKYAVAAAATSPRMAVLEVGRRYKNNRKA